MADRLQACIGLKQQSTKSEATAATTTLLAEAARPVPGMLEDYGQLLVLEARGGGRWYQPRSLAQAWQVLQAHPGVEVVLGDTGRSGVYRAEKETAAAVGAAAASASDDDAPVLCSLQDVRELQAPPRTTRDAGTGVEWLEVGAWMTLSGLMALLEEEGAGGGSGVGVRAALLAHLRKVAGTLVRNAGSLGGNLFMAKAKNFDSDLATLLGGLGARLTVATAGAVEGEVVDLLEYLNRAEAEVEVVARGGANGNGGGNGGQQQEGEKEARVAAPPPRHLLVRIHLPLTSPSSSSVDVFRSYRAALRHGNSHAFANAACRAQLDPATGRLLDVRVCVGALGMPARRATGAEAALCETSGGVLDDAALQAALLALRKEVVPASKTRYRYRLELLSAFLFKFVVALRQQGGGGGVDPRVASAAEEVVEAGPRPLPVTAQVHRGGVKWLRGEGEEKGADGQLQLAHAPLSKDYEGTQATGEAVYVSDVAEREGTLHAAYVKSPRAVGVLAALDAEAARAVPGVVAVLTAADVPGENDSAYYFGPPDSVPDTVLVPVGGRVQFHSQPVALVVAASAAVARRAAALVEAVFEGFEAPLVTIGDARDAKRSMGIKDAVKRGDAAAVLARAHAQEADGEGEGGELRVVTGAVRSGSQKHFYLETQCAYAEPDPEGRVLLHSSTQAPQAVQEVVARVLGVPMNHVQVRMRRAGGAFGAKATRNLPHAAAAAVAARVLGRPVRLTLDRETDMQLTGGRHAMEAEYEAVYHAATGRLEAVRAQVWLNGGFCADLSFTPCHDLAVNLEGAYHIPHFDAAVEVLRTNLPASTTMRAPGVVQAAFLMESVLEHVAADMAARGGDMSPEAVRRANFFRGDVPDAATMQSAGCLHMPSLPVSHFTLPALWEELAGAAKLEKRRAAAEVFNAAHRWRKRGVAMTPVKFLSPLMAMQATVNAYPDGSLLVHHGGCEIGQGIHAKSALVALQALASLGVADPPTLGQVRFADTDTDSIPNGGYTAASTTSERACAAVDAACREMVARLAPLRDRLRAQEGRSANAPVTWRELVKAALGFRESLDLCCHAQYKPAPGAHYHNYGAAVVEAEVDALTGEVELLGAHLLYDCGKSVNPLVDVGQVEGAFVQGLGFFLTEEALIASDGALQSAGTWEYKPPMAADLPREWRVALLENGAFDKGFLSSKASGEPPLVLATAAMMALRRAVAAARAENGLAPAQAQRFRLDAPATPERVHRACGTSMGLLMLNPPPAAGPGTPAAAARWLDETPRRVQVAVAGAGLGGLAVAIALDKLGLDAALFERAPALRDVSQGLVGITPNGLRALELIDPRLREYLMEKGKYNTEAWTKTVDERGEATERIVQFEAHNVSIPWADIQHSLARLVPKRMINCSHDFAGFDEDEAGGHVTVYFKGRVETVQAEVLVGVDGLFSVVRKGLAPFPDGDGDAVCESAHTNWNAIMHPGDAGLPYPHPVVSLTYQKEHPPRFFFIIECGHGRVLWQVRVEDPGKEYTVAPKKGHGRLGLAGVKRRILELVEDVPDVRPYIAATPEETIFERCLLFRKSLHRYSSPGRRVVLVGDAAHAMHSVRGQGANMTFEDAHHLMLALAAKGVGPSAVRVFERARIPRANAVQWESNTYYKRQFERNTSHEWKCKFLGFQSCVKDFHKHETLPAELL